MTSAPKEPAAPASVGVNNPPYMPPMTSATSDRMGNSFIAAEAMDSSDAESSVTETSPIHCGRHVAMARIRSAKATDRIRPGTIAAINSTPTDCSARNPYTISNRLGGISMPSTDEPATTPTENRAV